MSVTYQSVQPRKRATLNPVIADESNASHKTAAAADSASSSSSLPAMNDERERSDEEIEAELERMIESATD